MNRYIQIAMSLLGTIPALIATAEEAFSGKPGSGAEKKRLVTDAARAMMNTLSMVPGVERSKMLSPEFQDKIMNTVDVVIEEIVKLVRAAKEA